MNTIVFTFVSHGQNLRIEASVNKYGMIGHGWHLFINIPAAALGDWNLAVSPIVLRWGESSKPAAILKAFRNIMLFRKIQEVWRRFVRFGEFRMKLGRLGPQICGILRLVWNLWGREPWGCAVCGWAFGKLGLGSSQPFLMGEVKWINYTRYSINLY